MLFSLIVERGDDQRGRHRFCRCKSVSTFCHTFVLLLHNDIARWISYVASVWRLVFGRFPFNISVLTLITNNMSCYVCMGRMPFLRPESLLGCGHLQFSVYSLSGCHARDPSNCAVCAVPLPLYFFVCCTVQLQWGVTVTPTWRLT